LFERLEAKLEKHAGNLPRAAVELAKDWRTDKYLRRLEALMAIGDKENSFIISGTGDVLEPEVDVIGIGSGGNYALAAGKVLMETDKTAEEIAKLKDSTKTRGKSDLTQREKILLLEKTDDLMFSLWGNVQGKSVMHKRIEFGPYEAALPMNKATNPLIFRCLWTSYDYLSQYKIQDDIVEEFDFFGDWMEKYEHIISFSKDLSGLSDDQKTSENLVKGCQSQVWLTAKEDGKNLLFDADSDAIITRGLVGLLVKVLSNHTPQEITNADLYFIDKIGLKEHLSPNRSNGLVSMVKK